MANLTAKELAAIKDQLGQEQLMVKKYKGYAQFCTDPQIKSKCEQVAAQHQNHYDTLFKLVN